MLGHRPNSAKLIVTIMVLHRLFFRREHIAVTGNLGEKRESLNILEKVGFYDGLFDKICTEKKVGWQHTQSRPLFRLKYTLINLIDRHCRR
jgi:hypothetical protein